MSDSLSEFKHAIRGINFLVDVMVAELTAEMSLNQLRVLTEVMYRTTVGVRSDMGDVGHSLKLNRGTISRLVASLTAEGYADRPGLDLLRRVEYVRDRRRKTLVLTDRGRELCKTLGLSVRRVAMESRDRILEVVADSADATIRCGIDAEHGVCVYLVSGLYLTGTYRQIVASLSKSQEYRLVFNEITDLTDAETFEMDDAGVSAGIAIEKAIAGLTRRRIFLATDAQVICRLKAIEAQFRDAGLETFACVSSLEEARELLQLPADWQYPATTLLTL